jgi:hypothetical protein
MPDTPYDLTYDPNEIGVDLVVGCHISRGPRGDDPSFDPQVGDWIFVGDDEEEPLRARTIRRDGDRVWVQVQIPNLEGAAG